MLWDERTDRAILIACFRISNKKEKNYQRIDPRKLAPGKTKALELIGCCTIKNVGFEEANAIVETTIAGK